MKLKLLFFFYWLLTSLFLSLFTQLQNMGTGEVIGEESRAANIALIEIELLFISANVLLVRRLDETFHLKQKQQKICKMLLDGIMSLHLLFKFVISPNTFLSTRVFTFPTKIIFVYASFSNYPVLSVFSIFIFFMESPSSLQNRVFAAFWHFYNILSMFFWNSFGKFLCSDDSEMCILRYKFGSIYIIRLN